MAHRTRMKVKKRYRKPLDSLSDKDIVLIHDFNTYASIRRTMNSIDRDLMNMCPVGANLFGISHKGKKPRLIDENDEFVFYEF